MKKFLITLTIAGLVSFCSLSAFAQTNPPDPGGSPETGSTALGGSAPIGGGLGILLVLGAAYGGKKVYKYFKEENEEPES
ncbi:MAG: hypothetical protein GXO81_13305 [Chlorobi bacterium]|nr:hypothetical protein [Chlorobiota bacterium]